MSAVTRLLSGRLLAGNVIWSLIGAGLPLFVGVLAIPVLIDGLGNERFGLLAIIWMAVGYFSLFDLGIGRALTKLVAEGLGKGEEKDLPHLITVGVRLMGALGFIAALFVAGIAPALIEYLLHVPDYLRDEATWSFWLVAGTLPFVVSTAGLIGILQAYQRFRAVSLVRLPLGIANFVGPVLVLSFTDSLIATTTILVVSRILAWFSYFWLCKDYCKSSDKEKPGFHRSLIRKLLAFGGWITVSNIIGPMMVYFDRLLIGSVLGLVAVTYYTTPYEVVTRLWFVPNALADVLFPALSTALVVSVSQARKIFISAALAQMSVMFLTIALLTLFSPEILRFWLSDDFALHSTNVLHWLLLGVYVNCFARMPYALLQSKGRPDITAKLHFIELPIYMLSLWALMRVWGIEGAAMAWAGRIIIDAVLLFLLAGWKIPEIRHEQYMVMAGVIFTTLVLSGLWIIEPLHQKMLSLIPLTILTLLVLFALFRSTLLTFPITGLASQSKVGIKI